MELAKKKFIGHACDHGLFFTYKSNNLPNEDDDFNTLADASLVDALNEFPSSTLSLTDSVRQRVGFPAWLLVTPVFDSLDYLVAD